MSTLTWAVTPKPVKKVRRGVRTVAHPIEAAEFAVENQIVYAVRSRGNRTATQRADGLPARFTDQWIRRTLPRLSAEQVAYTVTVMHERGWTDSDLAARVYPYTLHR